MIESTLVSQAHFSPTKSTLQGVVYAMWSPLLKASTGNWPRKFFNLKKMNRLSSVEWVSEWKLACSNLSWPQSRQCSTTKVIKEKWGQYFANDHFCTHLCSKKNDSLGIKLFSKAKSTKPSG